MVYRPVQGVLIRGEEYDSTKLVQFISKLIFKKKGKTVHITATERQGKKEANIHTDKETNYKDTDKPRDKQEGQTRHTRNETSKRNTENMSTTKT